MPQVDNSDTEKLKQIETLIKDLFPNSRSAIAVVIPTPSDNAVVRPICIADLQYDEMMSLAYNLVSLAEGERSATCAECGEENTMEKKDD